ncbi:MAG: hypothetical protein WD181_06095 [Solirubrobacterales bacterium]
MPGPKLAVRMAIIAFGLMILLGAWLVSQSEPQQPNPSTPQSSERPLANWPNADRRQL